MNELLALFIGTLFIALVIFGAITYFKRKACEGEGDVESGIYTRDNLGRCKLTACSLDKVLYNDDCVDENSSCEGDDVNGNYFVDGSGNCILKDCQGDYFNLNDTCVKTDQECDCDIDNGVCKIVEQDCTLIECINGYEPNKDNTACICPDEKKVDGVECKCKLLKASSGECYKVDDECTPGGGNHKNKIYKIVENNENYECVFDKCIKDTDKFKYTGDDCERSCKGNWTGDDCDDCDGLIKGDECLAEGDTCDSKTIEESVVNYKGECDCKNIKTVLHPFKGVAAKWDSSKKKCVNK